MTDWTTISDANLDPAEPIRSIDGKALRDNPIAITEGASGAPRIATSALRAPTAGTANIILRIQEVEVRTLEFAYPDPTHHRFYSAEQHLGFTALVAGTVTCYFLHRCSSGTAQARIIKNGTVLNSWSVLAGGSILTRQQDVSVNIGDVVIFQQKGQVSGDNSFWKNIRVYSNNPDMAVA